MLDITYIREHADEVKLGCEKKQLDPSVVDAVLAADMVRRELIIKVEALRAETNNNTDKIKLAVQQGGKPDEAIVARGKEIKQSLKELEQALSQAESDFAVKQLAVPNLPAADVPVGRDETENQVVRQVGEKRSFEFEPKPHHEVMESLGILDTKRAVRIGGFRSYFLKGDGILLEQSLLRFALDLMVKHGFTPLSAPVLVNKDAMEGTGYFPWGQDDHYVTQDGQILAGTSEVALTAYYQGEILNEKDLPIKMVGISPCFRREIGSYGKDTKGIVRVHQFNKVEQVVYTVADEQETRTWHEKMLGYSEELLTQLDLPYQVLLMCSGDMGAGQRKKYDIETWFPAQEKYRETHSASYFNDFQSRRLQIKYRAKDGTTKYVYTLNNTVAASPRLLAAIIENYQQEDGTVQVPVILQPYLGKTRISR
jgi:seryl-tRNA synthetase